MKNNITIILSVLLILSMLLGVTACNKTTSEITSSDIPSTESVESNPSTDEEIPSEESTDISSEESFASDDEWEDIPDLEEDDEVYSEELVVENAGAPLSENFLGINGVHMGFAYMPDEYGRQLTERQAKLEYDRIAYTMGIKQVRTFYTSAMVWDNKKGEFDFKSADFLGFVRSLKELQNRGIDVAISPHWSLVSFVKEPTNYNSTSFDSAGLYVKDDLEATMKKYRKFMSDSILAFEANGIKNIKYLLAYTECNNSFLKDENEGLETYFEKRQYDRVCALYDTAVTTLDTALKDINKRNNYKIVGPCDNFRMDFDYTDPEQYSTLTKYTLENLSDKVDIIGTHIYSLAPDFIDDSYYYNPSTTCGKTVEMAKAAGKEIWMDEFNASLSSALNNDAEQNRLALKNPSKGVALAASVNGVMNSGFSNVFLWQLADNQWPNTSVNNEFDNGMQICGFMPSPLESVTPYPSWYTCSLLTRYIGQGQTYNTLEGYCVYGSAIKRNDGHWTVVVTNYNVEDTPIKVNFEKSIGGKTVYRHLYTISGVTPTPEAKVIGVSAKANRVTTEICDSLPGYSVAVYTTDPN